LPTLILTKDFETYMTFEEAASAETKFGPGELWGFNTGGWVTNDLSTLLGNSSVLSEQTCVPVFI
jgi:hypothetical protein